MELMLGLLPPPQVEIPPKLVALADEVIDETLITLFGGGGPRGRSRSTQQSKKAVCKITLVCHGTTIAMPRP